MTLNYDSDADALYIRLVDGDIWSTFPGGTAPGQQSARAVFRALP